MLCGTEQLIGSLPEVKWAQQVRSLATELQEESLNVIVQNLPRVIRTQAFQDLCRVRLREHAPLYHDCIRKGSFLSVRLVVTEGRVDPRAHLVEEAVFSCQRRRECGQLL